MNVPLHLWLAMGVTMALAGGCAEHTKPGREFDGADGAGRPSQRMMGIQRSAGARADGNLYAAHFTDDTVNSLGRAKLDAMVGNDETVRPLTIHLAPAPDHAALLRRIESVTAYLKDNGLADTQMHFVAGLNEGSYHRSALDLANLRETDTVKVDAPAAPPGPRTGDGGVGLLIK